MSILRFFHLISVSLVLLSSLVFYFQDVIALELPRGVPFSRASFYQFGTPFRCLDGSSVCNWYQVNDNSCDCFDGSDEPGTPACANGIFFCNDVQYKSVSFPSSLINDGVCDCCDGSDEYNSSVSCESTCGSLAAAVQQARSAKKSELEEGHRIVKEYVAKLKKQREEERIAAEEQASLNQHTPDTEQESPVSIESENISAVDQSSDAGDSISTVPDDQSVDTGQEDDLIDTNRQFHSEDSAPEEQDVVDADHLTIEETPHPPSTESTVPHKPIDYGPEEAFFMLAGTCLEYSDLQYTYKLCPFQNVYQNGIGEDRNGVLLGKWNDWSYLENDTSKENKYALQIYDEGATCWNGPARSSKVYIHCGNVNVLSSVSEPSRCEYEIHLRSPAACYDDPESMFKQLYPEDS